MKSVCAIMFSILISGLVLAQDITTVKPVVTTQPANKTVNPVVSTQPARPIPIEPLLLTIEASNALGSAKYEVLLKSGFWNEKTEEFEWTMPDKSMPLIDPRNQARIGTVWLAGVKLANVTKTKMYALCSFDVKVYAEQKYDTQFVFSSPLVITQWPNIHHWEVTSKATVSLWDMNHDGAKADSLNDGIFWCSVNGPSDPFVFAKLVKCVDALPDKTTVVTEAKPKDGSWVLLPQEVESHTIRTVASFCLSAGDQASVSGLFQARPVKD